MSSIINGAGLNSLRSQFNAGTTYAIAEIIDNSIQWKRSDVDCEINIVLIEYASKGSNWKLDEILIVDNGVGMDKQTIEVCLNFGGGKNHGTEENGKLGKFGLGLPYSSCSQSPNYHVFSWEDRDSLYKVHRDHSKYKSNEPVVAEIVEKLNDLPDYIYECIPEVKSYKSGTIVNWKSCDKLDVSQAKTLINHINQKLGRIYRHYINNGVKINFIVLRTTDRKHFDKVNDLCNPIGVFDPMFLMTNTILPIPYNNVSTNIPWGGNNGSGEKIIEFKEEVLGGIKIHLIRLRFSLVKSDIQLLGGNTEIGDKFYKKAQGISLVRANRELKLGNFDFEYPNGTSDPRHRWWSIEVLFEPISDDIMGVTANKLDALNFRYLNSGDFIELEQNGLIDQRTRLRHELSIEIDKAIKEMFKIIKDRGRGLRSKIKCSNCGEQSFIDGKCDNCGYTSDVCDKHGIKLNNGKCFLCEKTPDLPMCLIHKIQLENDKCPKCPERIKDLTDDETKELVKILKEDYPEIKDDPDSIERIINWFTQSNRKHFIIFTDLRSSSIFINHHDFQDKFIIIEVNTKHPFYTNFIENIIKEDEIENLTPLLLFIASWIETEKKDYSNSEILERFRSSFGTNLMEVIANWR